MTVMEELSGGDGKGIMMIEGRVLKPQDIIHDLLDVLEDSSGFPGRKAFRAGEPAAKGFTILWMSSRKSHGWRLSIRGCMKRS